MDKWLETFFYPYLNKAWDALVETGRFVLYISDIPSGDNYIDKLHTYMSETLKAKYLGVIAVGTINHNGTASRFWPLWVWQKPLSSY